VAPGCRRVLHGNILEVGTRAMPDRDKKMMWIVVSGFVASWATIVYVAYSLGFLFG